MKSFCWLWVVPYVVIQSTNGYEGWMVKTSSKTYIAMGTEEAARDMAEALNDAHAIRLENQAPSHKIGFSIEDDSVTFR